MASHWQTSPLIEAQAIPARRHLALHLPRWATESLRRADPALVAQLDSRNAPLALYEKQQGAMRLVELDARAAAAGLFVTQSLSDARALLPALVVREIERPSTESRFADFADWHSNASPLAAVHTARAAYGDLVLDITGVAQLFGGEARMLATLTGRLEQRGFTVSGAIADSIGAAWALAHFASGTILDGDPAARLANLPVAALRLDEATVDGLTRLGLKQIGTLYGRDRRALAARFGKGLLLRLDQALGEIEEKLTPRLPPAEFHAERRFAEPVGLIDDVLMTAHDLAIRLSSDLEQAGLGAQEFCLFLYCVDHRVITMAVKAGRATRDPAHIARLFANRAERLGSEYDAGFGIDMIRLGAAVTSPLDAAQLGAFETRDGTADLDRLYDRISSRLGPEVISRIKFVDTHIPERAMRLESAIARTPDNPRAAPDAALPRPLRLLPAPEPIEVMMAEVPDGPPRAMIWRRVRYRFLRARGPERIGAEWWRHAGSLAPSRSVSSHKPERASRDDPAPDATPPNGNRAALPGTGQPATGASPGTAVQPAKANSPADPDRPSAESHPSAPETTRPSAETPQPGMTPFAAETVTRDYFLAEDDGGRRFWLFREGLYGAANVPRWFVHGFFA